MKWEGLTQAVSTELDHIQEDMYVAALKERDANMHRVNSWEEFMDKVNHKSIVLAKWCNVKACEEAVKDRSKEESLQ